MAKKKNSKKKFPNKKTIKVLRRVGILLAALLVLLAGLVGYIAYAPILSKETILYVPSKATYKQVYDSLRIVGKIDDTRFEIIAKLKKYPNYIKPGRYVLEKGSSAMNVVNKLRSGDQDEVKLHFGRVRSLEELAAKIGSQIEADSARLMSLFQDEVRLSAYCIEAAPLRSSTVLACFIPNTYFLNWNTSEEELMERMMREQEAFWTKERIQKAQKLKMDRVEIITLASIVEMETDRKSDKKDIASVYLNRLRLHMPLQADPTVKFAVGNMAIKRIKGTHIRTDSPYNTYMYAGLPPGPICTPTAESIEAVLSNKRTPYLFFCAEEDFSGRHAFASNLRDHNENARQYHAALNEKKIK